MKNNFLFLAMCLASLCSAQSLLIDFESNITTTDFIDFDGGMATVINNPHSNGINTSNTVAQIIRNGGEIWAGSKINLTNNLNFSTDNIIAMKVFTTAPIGTVVKFKLEGNGSVERDATTTTTNQWEELSWDFTGTTSDFNSVVFMFDFGSIGNGTESSTFLFDDVQQIFGGIQIDFPVDFEGNEINYAVTDFGGNVSSRVLDPENANNHVIQSIKTNEAATWAGTTIGTPAGFATDLPLTLSESKMTVRVWSPAAGVPIRLKVEDSNDPTHTCETETKTTVAGWEMLEFDFNNQAPGTELLSVGLQMGWTFNMASIFFNFDTPGGEAGEQTYYFDDVTFGSQPLSTFNIDELDIDVSPNPSYDIWRVHSSMTTITQVEIWNMNGTLLDKYSVDENSLEVSSDKYLPGMYLAKISTERGTGILRLIKSH